MKSKTKILLGSALTIAMCASLITGSTLALFTSEAKTNIAVTSGKVDVDATIGNLRTYSYTETSPGTFESTAQGSGKFIYGTATLDESNRTLTLSEIVPGDKAEFNITLTNNSTVAIKYQIMMTVEGDEGFYKALDVSLDGEEFIDSELSSMKLSKWKELDAEGTIPALTISIELPYTYEDKIVDGNEEGSIQGKTCILTVAVQAVQGNAHTTDPVPVDPESYPETTNLVPIYSLAELEAFRKSVNSGEKYYGKTVQLFEDIDLENKEWDPIGTSTTNFEGTFDGQGHIISNLKISDPTEDAYVGFFRGTAGSTVIENLELHNASVVSRSDGATPYFSSGAALIGNAYCAKVTNVKLTGLVQVVADYFAGGISGYTYIPDYSNIEVNVEPGSYVKAMTEDAGGVIAYIGENGLKQVTNIKSTSMSLQDTARAA